MNNPKIIQIGDRRKTVIAVSSRFEGENALYGRHVDLRLIYREAEEDLV